MVDAPLFHPTFGSRPSRIVGRDIEIESILNGLHTATGARERCTLILGQRGMGKTALLLEVEERAKQEGYVVARVSHNEDMLEEVIELIQLKGSPYVQERKRPVKGFSAGALGFSVGLTFTETTQRNYGFRVKLDLLCQKLEESGKGVLVLVDEVKTSEKMRQLATTYQNLVGDERSIAMCMAGLPHAVSSVLNDSVLTFLNRAQKIKLGPISNQEVRAYYASAFEQLGLTCSQDILDSASHEAAGFPYLMQLIGFYIVRYAEGSHAVDASVLKQAIRSARSDFEDNVFSPILAPLSDKDRLLLDAMSQDDGPSKVADLLERMGMSDSRFQPYRARMIDAGIVESPRRGELVFAVPFLADYLRSKNEALS
ncbi:MAG: AAA family ATPase [Eggerthellaceae bacterium]|nr:AAA family ATPase [Eggerthellaceae bacterium]